MASNSKRTLYLIIIFLLLLTNIVAGYFWLNSNKDNEKLTVEKTVLQSEYNGIQQDLSKQMAELEAMKGTNAELDAIIVEREKEIEEQQAKISKLFRQKNFTSSELKKAKAMISSLEIQNTSFMHQIDSLNRVTIQLQEDKVGLETDLTNQKTEYTKLEDENKYLDDKFELGSLLRADELKISGIKIKANGVEKELNRIKRIQKIKVCYQTGINKVREQGEATMYLVLMNPKGQVIHNEANGSGTFTDKEGKKVRFSKRANFEYMGKNKNICIYWTEQFIDAGVYKAILYNDGYQVGESEVEFK